MRGEAEGQERGSCCPTGAAAFSSCLGALLLAPLGWAGTPGQGDAGRERDTLGQGQPKGLQPWVTHLGTEQEEKQ